MIFFLKLHCLQPGVSRHQPFDSLALKSHLQSVVLAAAFEVDNSGFAKLRMPYALA